MGVAQASRAFELYAARRARDTAFGEAGDGFGEPAWDMLLMLYVHDASARPITRDDLLSAAGSAKDVAARYLDWMISRELASVGAGCEVRLEDAGRARMDAYLEDERGG